MSALAAVNLRTNLYLPCSSVNEEWLLQQNLVSLALVYRRPWPNAPSTITRSYPKGIKSLVKRLNVKIIKHGGTWNHRPEEERGRFEGVGRVLARVQLFDDDPRQHLEDQRVLLLPLTLHVLRLLLHALRENLPADEKT